MILPGDSGVIGAGDGAALGEGLAVLMLAAILFPLGVVIAWSLFRSFFDGEEDD